MRWPVKAGNRVRKQDWKVDGRRKLAVGRKVQPEDSIGRRRVGSWSEGEAGRGSIRCKPEADLKVERRMQFRGKLAVDPLAQPKDGRPMRVGRKSPAQPEDATPRESGVGRRGS